MSETMKAVVLTGHGGLDKLEYREDWPMPQPGPGEVIVKVGACGLNNTDVNTRTAWYSDKVTEGITDAGGKSGFDEADGATGTWGAAPLSFPRIQGADVAGRIADKGALFRLGNRWRICRVHLRACRQCASRRKRLH